MTENLKIEKKTAYEERGYGNLFDGESVRGKLRAR